MPQTYPTHRFFHFLYAALLCLAAPLHAQSQWAATTSGGFWSDPTSWSSGTAPVSGSSASIIFGGSTSYTSTNDIPNFNLNQLVFNNTAGTVTLADFPTTNPLIFVNSDSGAPTVALTGAGSATISSQINYAAETTVTNSGSGTLLLSGAQVYSNGTKQTFVNSGTGTLTLADGTALSTTGSNTGLVLSFINNNAAVGSFNVGNLGPLANVTFNVGGTGTVRFNGSIGGDLFTGSAILNVLNGGTFDFNGNGESFGGIEGAGTIVTTVAVNISAGGYFVYSGKMTGKNGNLTVSGANTNLVVSNTTSDYTGATAVTSGRLIVSGNAPQGSAGALGNATTEVLVGDTDTSITANASLLIDTAGITIGRNIRVQTGSTGLDILGGLNASGTTTFSGNITMGTNLTAARALTLSSTAGGTVAFTGNLLRATGATGVTDTVTIIGGGTVVMAGANTYTGATTVAGGTLVLDDTTNNGRKLSTTAALTVNGSLTLLGNSGAASSETVSSTTLGGSAAPLGGGGRITVTSGTDQNASLNLGSITRNSGATIDFLTINTGTGLANINTTNTNTAAGILGGWATYNKADWAVVDASGNVTALAAGNYTSSFGAGLHTSVAGATSLSGGNTTTNTLRITSTAAITFSATGTLTLESGGLMVTASAGATSIGTTTTRGTLTSSTGEVIIHQESASTLTINSVITGTNLTKAGDGNLVLTGTNTYTGNTIINGGTVTVSNANNLGTAVADVTLNGGTLVTSASLGTLNSANRVITIGSAGGTLNTSANISMEGSGLAGSGTFTKAGVGTISVGSSASTFTGNIVIAGGAIAMNSAQFNSAASVTVLNGGSYTVTDDATGTFSLSATGRFVLNGYGVNNTGALRLTDQTMAVAGKFDPITTINREVNLQTTSRIQVENGSAPGSLSTLILTSNVTGDGGLIKSGNGVLVLTARDNSYAGATNIENGTLRISSGNDRLPTNTMVTLGFSATSGILSLNGFTQTIAGLSTNGGMANEVTNGSAAATSILTLNSALDQNYDGTLGGSNVDDNHNNNNLDFIKDGAGSELLNGANTYNGLTTIRAGSVALGHSNALGNGGASLATGNGGTTVLSGATLDLNGQTDVNEVITLNGQGVGGKGALINNSFLGASLGSGVSSLSFSNVSTTGWSSGASVTIAAPVTGGTQATGAVQLGLSQQSISLTNGGSGFGLTPTVTVSGGNGAVVTAQVGVTTASYTITGGTTVYSTAPNVVLQNGATATAILSNGTSGTVIGITVTNPGANFSGTPTISFSGGVVSTAGTNPTGTGNLLNFTIVSLTVVNPGTGFTSVPVITITGGTGATALGVDGNFILNGVSITSNGSGYTSTPRVTITGGTATATANLSSVTLASNSSVGSDFDLTINSVINGTGAFTKVGSGTTTLAAANTYTGATTVSQGNLQVGIGGVGSTGTSAVTVNGSGAILSGTGMVSAPLTVISGAIKPGDNGGALTGTLHTQSLVFAPAGAGTVAELQIMGETRTGNLSSDQISITGDLTMSTNGFIFVNGTGYNPNVGDAFTLLSWTGALSLNGFDTGSNFRTGNNADGNEGNLDLPDISGRGVWDISMGSGALIIRVEAVPEPNRALLAGAGLLFALARRRRSTAG